VRARRTGLSSPQPAAVLLVVAATACWWATLFVPVTRSGLGSSGASHRLADLALSGAVAPLLPAWTGLAWYGLGLVGCAVLALAGARSRPLVALRAALAVAGAAVGCAAGLVLGGPAELGPAVWLAAAGAAAALAATVLTPRPTPGSPA
jgi:hypothetical protein